MPWRITEVRTEKKQAPSKIAGGTVWAVLDTTLRAAARLCGCSFKCSNLRFLLWFYINVLATYKVLGTYLQFKTFKYSFLHRNTYSHGYWNDRSSNNHVNKWKNQTSKQYYTLHRNHAVDLMQLHALTNQTHLLISEVYGYLLRAEAMQCIYCKQLSNKRSSSCGCLTVLPKPCKLVTATHIKQS